MDSTNPRLPSDFIPPPLNIGRYRVLELLGRGAWGDVYACHDPVLDRRVAVKVQRADKGSSEPKVLARFYNEVRVLSRLSHPNLVGVYDAGEQDGRPFLVMELCAGPALHRLLSATRLSPGETAWVMGEIVQALTYLHGLKVVHRDIKPGNLLFHADRLRLTDFGLVHTEYSELTDAGEAMGTPSYMAPEQVMGEAVDQRTDLYALGVLAFQMLAGRLPFEGQPIHQMYQTVNSRPPTFSEVFPGLHPGLDAFFDRALARAPVDRFETAGALYAALLELLPAPCPVKLPPALAPKASHPLQPTDMETGSSGQSSGSDRRLAASGGSSFQAELVATGEAIDRTTRVSGPHGSGGPPGTSVPDTLVFNPDLDPDLSPGFSPDPSTESTLVSAVPLAAPVSPHSFSLTSALELLDAPSEPALSLLEMPLSGLEQGGWEAQLEPVSASFPDPFILTLNTGLIDDPAPSGQGAASLPPIGKLPVGQGAVSQGAVSQTPVGPLPVGQGAVSQGAVSQTPVGPLPVGQGAVSPAPGSSAPVSSLFDSPPDSPGGLLEMPPLPPHTGYRDMPEPPTRRSRAASHRLSSLLGGLAAGVAALLLVLGGIHWFQAWETIAPASSSVVHLKVDSSPPGARIELGDRTLLGNAPLKLTVPLGREHMLELVARKSGWRPKTIRREAHPGDELEVQFVLEPSDGEPDDHLNRLPPGAIPPSDEIGRSSPAPSGDADGSGSSTSPGVRPAPAVAPRADTPGASSSSTGYLILVSTPAARILIDNKPSGLTGSRRRIPVAAGAHEVELREAANGIRHVSREVMVGAGETHVLEYDFMERAWRIRR